MILMNDFKADLAESRGAMLDAVARVLDSGWYVLGKEVENFERRWADACGVGHGVGVGNGMDAIEIALRALGIGPGDEVVTTSMTAFATVLAVLRAGATPVLADIDPASGLLDPASVRRCLTPKTRALILVHLYGQVRRMDEWLDLARSAGIELIEDCAQAHLSQSRGRVAGSMGRAGAYSFYPTKNLGAIGDAGMLVTNDAALAARAGQIRNYGQSQRYHHPIAGMNSRLDELQAALLSVRLDDLPRATARRRQIAAMYRDGLHNPQVGQLAAPEEDAAHVHHLHVVTCRSRKALQDFLQQRGVQTLIHYPLPVHAQASCAGIAVDPQGMAHTQAHADTCLSLPCAPHLSDAEVAQVIDAVNAFTA